MGNDDYLISCLVYLTRFFETPFSADVIRAGLALTDDNLDITQFDVAAAKVGLESSIEKESLNKLRSTTLPVVLLLKNEHACVLTIRQRDL